MLARTHDAAFMNSVVNHPAIKPQVSLGMEGTLDLTPLVSDEGNVCLQNEHGGFLFIRSEHDCFDVHTQFLPEGRGPAALASAREAAWFMFTQTHCLAIRTFVGSTNHPARALTKRMGFVKIDDGELFGVTGEWFLLTIKQWARGLCQSQAH